MPAAVSKPELLAVTQKEYAKLLKVLGTVDPATALIKGDEDTSIKDIVAHRAHWIDLFLGWYADGQAGKEVHFPAPGYKWNDLKRYNADLRARQTDLDWAGAREALDASTAKLVGLIEALSEEDLYGGPMKGGRNDWTPGRWAEAAGASHFRSATKAIRAQMRALG